MFLLGLCAVPFAVFPLLATDPPLRETPSQLEKRTFDAINLQRALSQLAPLVWDDALCRTAREHSRRMLEAGFFAHEDPRFGDLRARLDTAGVVWWLCGENLFRETHHPDPVAIAVVDWMYSEGHRKNILSTEYTLSAVGAAIGPDGTVVMTQQFLTPVPPGKVILRQP
jgi:uncharacterized protein YkwD